MRGGNREFVSIMQSETNVKKVPRLPLAALPASAVAFTSLALATENRVLTGVLGIALFATYASEARGKSASRGVWAARIFLYTWVLFSIWNRFGSEAGDSLEILLAFATGELAACELVIQAWLAKPFGGARGAIWVGLSCAVMLGASNTFEAAYIRFLVPVFMVFFAMSLRAFGAPQSDSPQTARGVSRRGIAGLAIVLAVISGMSLHAAVWGYRYEIGQLGARFFNETKPEAIGLSTEPHLGATFGDGGSLSRVLRLTNWPARQSYLRVMSFSTYGDARWTPLIDNRKFGDVAPTELRANAEGKRAQIERLIDDEGLMPAPLNSAGIAPPLNAQLEWEQNGGPLRSKDPAPSPFIYDVVLPPRESFQGPLSAPPTRAERANYLKIPDEIPSEVKLLALKIGGGFVDPREQVRAVEKYLMETHAYSLTTKPGAGDPTASFLLDENKAAHCEYFASAAAMLLRSLGIPTRYVIGYYVHERDGDATIVRMRDAHAWCESWIDGVGWISVDATPGGARPDQVGEPIPFWLHLRERVQDFVMLIRNSLAHLNQIPRAIWIFIGVFILFRIVVRSWKKRPAKSRSFVYQSPPQLQPFARRFEKLMRKRGALCPLQKTWREHLETLQPAPFDIALGLQWLRIYNRARFASQDENSQRADLARLHEILRTLEKSTSKSTPE